MKNRILQIKRVLSVALLVLLLIVAGVTNLKAQNNTSYSIEAISNPVEGGTVTITNYTQGEEKVINGDFEQGNVGFTSGYYYDYDFDQGGYYVDIDAHGRYEGIGHGGMGNFMLMDGATEPGTNIWMEQISVEPDTYYAFSSWVCTLYPESMARLQFSINGTQVGDVFIAPSQTNTWEQFYVIWYSSNSTTAIISILDQNTEGGGNDFGLDDISFRDLTMIGTSENAAYVGSGETCSVTAIPNEGYTFYQWKENGNVISMENPISFVALFDRSLEACFVESSVYPLLYSFNEEDRTATVIGHWDGVELTGELVIPETVMHNGETYTVKAIGDWAFNGCSGLTSVILSDSLVSIGFAAFEGCSGLTSIVFPNTLVSISDRAFMGCSLTEVVIPESVDLIGGNPFQMCSNIEQITVEFGNAYYDSRENCNAIIETSSNVLITGCQNTIIPNTVTAIGGSAFMDCAGLTSIVVPASVSSIGFWAFRATGLTSMIVEATTPPELSYVDPWHSTFGGVNKSIPVYIPCASIEAYQIAEGWNEFTNFIGMCPGTIAVTANPAEYGTVTGGGSYEGGEICTVTAMPNEGYFFECWKENNRIVSTEVSYSFVVTGDRNLTANFYTPQPGMLNGQFSVGENQLVCFSQGNLQYQASTNTWQFAEHQWDFVGEGNNNISSTYDGWIDLFGWGTSGHDHGAVCYQPWSASENNDDYHVYGSSLSSLYDHNGQADWGYNPISNGGNTANQWHTLTQLEWNYVFNTRTTTSGIRYAKAKVNNVYGVILLPDDWNSNTYSLNNTNSSDASFSSNTITNAQWTILEDAGAAFLPVGGYQYGTSFSYEDYFGCYWSALCNSDGQAYCVTFNDWYFDLNYDNRCCSRNVRLVRPAQANTSYSIEAVPNPTGGGTITGAGTYDYYSQVTLTATANESYTFYQWKENGNMVSTENPYSFVAFFDRNLEAVFLESSTYPLLYSFNEEEHTATVTGHWDGTNATGDLVIPETVMHNGETYTVTAIESHAFMNCNSLTGNLVIPNTVIYIGDHAFYGCSGITGELLIPTTISSISEGAFEYCRGITSVTYGTALTYIGNYAFRGCSSLASVELPNTLTSIGEWAFSECPITLIVFPSSLNSIGNEAFRDCSGLTEIVIPSSVTSIGGVNPFGGCSNLAQITVESENAYYDSRDDSYAIIETTTNKLVSGSLSTIIPNTVVSIGQNAFYRIQLSSITIPASVNHIGDWAFGDINTLPSMTVLAEVPPTLGGCAFCGTDHSIPVYVPCGSLEMYQNAEGWRDYGGFDFVELCPGVVAVTANPAEYGTVTGGGSYEGGEICTVTAMPNEGYFFAYWSENGRMVSAETTYSFLVIGNRDLTANFYTPQPGMINGLFSVSADQMVFFSQGNLQYQASTNTWRFADNQWDFVGESNSNASPTYDGWIDLYAWATSGYNHATDGYQPWSGGCNAYNGESLSLYDRTGKADWGYNAISNGGNEERMWRTCTGSELGYLMFDRQTASGIRFAKATIGETNGIILFPDNWAATLYNLNNVNQGEAPYDGNVISQEVWMSVFEANGAVFLPASGRIQSWAENGYNQCGMYWNSNDVYGYLKGLLSFGEDSMGLGAYYTDEHYSVRLVRAPANASYAIEAVSNPADAGTVEGSGIYDYYTAASLTAIPNEGYNFICWKENGRIVSTDNNYEVLALFDRNLEATFYETSTYPLTYSYNDEDHTAMVIGHWEGVELEGELVIPETVMHNGEAYMVTSIGEYALPDCSGLTSIVFSNSLVSIGNWAFRYCNGLTEVVIPSSVTSIGVNPFTECSNLVQITVALGNTYYDSRDDSHAIIETATNKLISGSLSTVIPSSVTSLGQDAFYIETIALMTVLAEIPPVVNVCSFCGVDKSIPVYVPCGTIEAYQNAEGWNEFTNFQEYIPELTVVSSDESMGTVAILQEPDCEHDAIVQATPIGDYSFFCWTENGEIVSTEATYTLPVEEDRTLTAHFGSLTNHWTPSGSYQNSMFMIGVVQIDGVEQASPFLELGAFCNGECRGSEFPFEDGGQWLYFMTIGGNAGDEITFRLYDHFLQQELNLYCFNVIPFEMYGLIGIEEPYEVQFTSILTISANVSPENAGTITGAGEYLLGTDVVLTATANEGYVFNSWTLDGEIVSTEPSYSFTVTNAMSFIANFDALYSVSAAVNLEDAGTIIGTGIYVSGTEATLIATPNAGYAFNSWTLDGEVVSTEPTYTFTVIEPVNLTANFNVVHTQQFVAGWNWWSTNLEITLEDLQTALTDALGSNASITIQSQSQNCRFIRGRWIGQLTSLDVAQMYSISVDTACEITLHGVPVNPADHPVTIKNGYNWIAFPLRQSMSVTNALSEFPAVNNDIIQSQTNNTIFVRGMWRGALTTFEPGQGYIFKSSATENRTLIFPSSAK